MAIHSDRSHVFGAEYAQAFDAVLHTAQAENLVVSVANPATGMIQLATKMSVFSWGENMGAQLHQIAPGTVSVRAWSGLKFGLVDWGRNNRNLDRFFARLCTFAPLAAAAWLPDPAGRHPLRWWDGRGWTDQVSDGTSQGADPIG